MIKLWDVQEQMVGAIRVAYRSGRAPLLVSPTGSGKTVMFSYMTQNHVGKGGRVMILVHRQELIDQVAETLERFDVPFSYIANGYPYFNSSVQIASVFSLVRRMLVLDFRPTLIIVDEAHHATDSTTWGMILRHYRELCNPRLLGVTATPWRLSGEGFPDFDKLVLGPGVQELIDRGYLSPFRVFCPSAQDLSRIRRQRGELVAGDLERQPDRPRIIGDALAHYHRLAPGKQAVAFALSVTDAQHIAQRFRDAGYQAAAVDGAMPDHMRRELVRDFKARTLRVLTSCDLISEGFDCPGIEVGISLRPTLSLGLWLQQMGRCLRTAPGKKEAILLDHAGNALRHGLPTEPREWSLSGSGAQKGERKQSVRVCPKCWAAMPSSAKVCKNEECKHVFEVVPRYVPKKEGDLQEMTAEQVAALRYKETQDDKRELDFLVELGRKRGYQNPERWAQHVAAGVKAKTARKARGVR